MKSFLIQRSFHDITKNRNDEVRTAIMQMRLHFQRPLSLTETFVTWSESVDI